MSENRIQCHNVIMQTAQTSSKTRTTDTTQSTNTCTSKPPVDSRTTKLTQQLAPGKRNFKRRKYRIHLCICHCAPHAVIKTTLVTATCKEPVQFQYMTQLSIKIPCRNNLSEYQLDQTKFRSMQGFLVTTASRFVRPLTSPSSCRSATGVRRDARGKEDGKSSRCIDFRCSNRTSCRVQKHSNDHVVCIGSARFSCVAVRRQGAHNFIQL